jgi:hypothetical protein
VRKILFIFTLAVAVAFAAVAAETLTLTDGSSQSGDIVKFDDNGLLLRAGDVYTNLAWSKLSQDSLKHLTESPKIKPYAEVFIEPDASSRPPKPEITVNPVTRLSRPANPSLLGGLFGSPVGWFIILVLYAANLYAGFEVSVIRARPAAQVIGLSAVLPVIGPVIFLAMPMKVEAPPEEKIEVAPAGTAAAAAQRTPEEVEAIQVAAAASQRQERKPEVQVFARGKFTFNKRFMETKFAGYIGEPKGDATQFSMEIKTAQAQFAVERILQVAATDLIIETVQLGQVTLLLTDILEIKLNPKTS